MANELKYTGISLNFMQETDIEEQIFEITIFTKLKEKNMLEKEDTIIDKLIDKYPEIESEYIILVES